MPELQKIYFVETFTANIFLCTFLCIENFNTACFQKIFEQFRIFFFDNLMYFTQKNMFLIFQIRRKKLVLKPFTAVSWTKYWRNCRKTTNEFVQYSRNFFPSRYCWCHIITCLRFSNYLENLDTSNQFWAIFHPIWASRESFEQEDERKFKFSSFDAQKIYLLMAPKLLPSSTDSAKYSSEVIVHAKSSRQFKNPNQVTIRHQYNRPSRKFRTYWSKWIVVSPQCLQYLAHETAVTGSETNFFEFLGKFPANITRLISFSTPFKFLKKISVFFFKKTYQLFFS